MSKFVNIYDRMIFLLIVSVVFGYLGSFFTSPIIILTILFSPWFLKIAPRYFHRNPKIVVVLFLLVGYGAISIAWSPDIKHSVVLFLRAIIHLLMCLELIVFSQVARNPLNTIAKAWVVAFFLTSGIAIMELVTDNHIMSIAHEDVEMDIVRQRAAVTFYNINTYSLFVVFSLPFLLYAIQTAKTAVNRFICLFILLILVSIVFLNASRGAILGMIIMIGVFAASIIFKGGRRGKRLALVAIVLLGVFMFFASDYLLETILYRTEDRDFFYDRTRRVLINSSLELFYHSYGLGNGFGSMIPSLTDYVGNTTDITYSHNLFLELLLEGGVVFGISFLVFYLKLFKKAIRIKDSSRKMFLYAVVLSFPICSIINSSYISPTFVWLFIVSVYIFSSINIQCVEPISSEDKSF